MTDTYKDYIWLISLFIIFAGMWYYFWIQPRDESMDKIMTCMGDDRSKEAFIDCRELVSGE